MAQQVNVSYVDDLDGSEAQGTISFGLDGTSYEIDLSRDNAARLRDVFRLYVGAARRVGPAARAGRATEGRKPAPTAEERERNRAVREWAAAQGMTISNRGRLPAEIVEAYDRRDAEPVVEPAAPRPRRSRAKAKAAAEGGAHP